jgi:xylulokinase
LTGYTAGKIAWLKRHRPALYAAMDCILLPHDYLNFWLTGERCMEVGDASGTGLLDIRKRCWSPEMLRALDPDRDLLQCLPALRQDNEPIGALQPERAAALGLPAGTPLSIGGGDNMMGAIGTGNLTPGSVTISLGTSGTVYAYSDKPVIDPQGNIAAFCSSTGGWLPLMCTMNCTVTTELLRGLLSTDISEFEALVGGAPRGSEGLITVPFFNGERTPNLPRAKGCIVGMDAHNTRRENLLRSGVEGATYALRYGIDELRNLGMETSEITLIGGGVNSASWRQIVADVCNAPVTVLQQDEGAAFGAVLQAMSLLKGGGQQTLQDITADHLTRNEAMCCEPHEPAVRFYEEAYGRYRQAMSAVAGLYQ